MYNSHYSTRDTIKMKKNGKKTTRILAALTVMVFIFTSCGKTVITPSGSTESVGQNTTEKVEKNTTESAEKDTTESTEKNTSETTKKNNSESEGQNTTETEEQNTTEPEGMGDGKETNAVTILQVETGHYYDYLWNDELQRVTVSLKYPYLNLSGEDRENYQKLEQTVSGLMKETEESSLTMYEETVRDANEFFSENTEYGEHYSVSKTVAVRRADSRVFSFVLDEYSFRGGIHGQPYTWGNSFDTETGEQLKITDVVTDVKRLPEIVLKQLEAIDKLEYLYDDLDLNEYFENNLQNISWVMDYHGITIYFNPYEIAPYASGTLIATIPFKDYPDLFEKKYTQVPENYCIEFTEGSEILYDVDGDGELDTLEVLAATGYEDYSENQRIYLNGEVYEGDTGIYMIEPTLVHMADNKNYLYLGQQYPDDIWVYEVFDLSGGKVQKVDMVYSGRHQISGMTEDCNARQVLTNPQNFMLDTFTEMLGTAFAYETYHVGADGLPQKDHDWYMIRDEREFTVRKKLTVSEVDEKGNITGETELNEGDKVIYYRTDREKWADLKLSDGRIVRVNPQRTDYEWTIDGFNVEEIFEGIIFAG